VLAIDASSQSFGEAGGTNSVGVLASGTSCAWLGGSYADWITLSGVAGGTGLGSITYTVSPNPTFAPPRASTIWIAGKVLTVSQSGFVLVCSTVVSPSSVSVAAPGLTGANLTVSSNSPDCGWGAVANVPWILVTGGNTGAGSGPVTFTVGINSGGPRTGSITAAGQTVTVTQAGVSSGCSYSLSSTSNSVPPNSGTGTLSATTAAGCAWSAVSNASWLTVTSGLSGFGNGTVGYSFAANPITAPRSGAILISGQTFTVTQAGATVSGPPPLRFVPVTPCRIADTRSPAGPFGGPSIDAPTPRDFNIPASVCGIPANAQAYSLNLTVVPLGPLGFLSVGPAGLAQPGASTLNSGDGRIKANAAIVPAGTNGAITVFASNPTHVIVDINGYFVPAIGSADLAFYPLAPCRIADTRSAAGTFAGPALAPNVQRNFPLLSSACGIPATAQAYALNLTVIPAGPLGFLSAWPAGSAQGSSTLNAPTGAITANAAIVPAGASGAITLVATDATDLIIDINGYFAPPASPGGMQFYTTTPCRILDTRGAAGPFGAPQLAISTRRDFVVSASACGIPATAGAYSLNATVVPPAPLGFLSLWGPGGQPSVSTLNASDGTIAANAALVPASATGTVSAMASGATHLILDINGYFAQ
jgi:hypothetical protein